MAQLSFVGIMLVYFKVMDKSGVLLYIRVTAISVQLVITSLMLGD